MGMTREEIIAGLKAGRALMLDGAATEDEREMIAELEAEGLVDVKLVHGDQYSACRITWRK
jgi:hypothetical protein